MCEDDGWLVGVDAVESAEKRSVESSSEQPVMVTETSASHTQVSTSLPVVPLSPYRPPTSAPAVAESALHHISLTMSYDAATTAAVAHSDGNWSRIIFMLNLLFFFFVSSHYCR